MRLNLKALIPVAFVVFASMGTPHAQRGQTPAPDLPKLEDTVVVTSSGTRSIISRSEYVMAFSGPFGVPGVSLPAGTYLFTFPMPGVIQVRSADRSINYAQFLTVSAEDTRRRSGSAGAISWRATRAGTPQQIDIWYPAGRALGWQFMYSKG